MAALIKVSPDRSVTDEANVPAADTGETAVATAPASAPAIGNGVCPRCQKPLVNPESLGWCLSCGYSRALEAEEKAKALLPQNDPSQIGLKDVTEAVKKVPAWAWVLLAGALAIWVGSLTAAFYLPDDFDDESFFYRALWGTVQLACGFLAVLVAQVLLIFMIGVKDDKLNPMDCLLFSKRMWVQAWKKLPETRVPFWLIAWSLVAMHCAYVIGGQNWWFYQLPEPEKRANPMLIAMVKERAEEKSMEEGLKDFADQAGIEEEEEKDGEKKKKTDKKKDKPKPRPTAEAVIIGYVKDKDDNLSGLVIAGAKLDYQLHYIGVVEHGLGLKDPPKGSRAYKGVGEKLTKSELEKLKRAKEAIAKLPLLRVDKCAISDVPALPRVTWVKPEIYCRCEFKDMDKYDAPIEPVVLEFLKEK